MGIKKGTKKTTWETEHLGIRIPVQMKREVERRALAKYQSVTDWIVSHVKAVLDDKTTK